MLRVLKVGGTLGISYSTESDNAIARWVSDKIEKVIWRFPSLSLGCRSLDIINDLKKLNVEFVEDKKIGFVPYFFQIVVVRKKPSASEPVNSKVQAADVG